MTETGIPEAVWLLRHGAPVGGTRYRGATDDSLSCEGRAQMQLAVDRCDAFDCVVASPLRRCMDFAAPLARSRGLPLAIEPRFREMHFGAWEGQTPQALMTACPESLRRFWRDPVKYPPPGGEPLDVFVRRVTGAWHAQLVALGERRPLLIVHGGTVRAILGHLHRLPPRELISLEVPYASLHRVNTGSCGEACMSGLPASPDC